MNLTSLDEADDGGWQSLEQPPPAVTGSIDADEQLRTRLDYARISPRVLADLRRITVEHVVSARASDAELRHHEGRRDLYRYIVNMIAQARAS